MDKRTLTERDICTNTPDPETLQADARFALDALPALTMRPDQIKALRQTILNLAVRGKLVMQDAGDEPASQLLQAVMSKRQRLAQAGIVRPENKAVDDLKSERLFDLPPGWTWTIADQLWSFENGDRSKNYPSKDQLVPKGIPFINAGHLEGGLVTMTNMNFISRAKFPAARRGQVAKRRSALLFARLARKARHIPSRRRRGDCVISGYSPSDRGTVGPISIEIL